MPKEQPSELSGSTRRTKPAYSAPAILAPDGSWDFGPSPQPEWDFTASVNSGPPPLAAAAAAASHMARFQMQGDVHGSSSESGAHVPDVDNLPSIDRLRLEGDLPLPITPSQRARNVTNVERHEKQPHPQQEQQCEQHQQQAPLPLNRHGHHSRCATHHQHVDTQMSPLPLFLTACVISFAVLVAAASVRDRFLDITNRLPAPCAKALIAHPAPPRHACRWWSLLFSPAC